MNRIDAIRLSKSNEYEKLATKNRIRDHMNEKAIRVIDKVEQNSDLKHVITNNVVIKAKYVDHRDR